MRRSLLLVLLLSLPAWVLAAVAPSNRMILRDPATNVKVVTGSVRFYAAGEDSTQSANQVDFDIDLVTSTWDNNALSVHGDSIRAGFYDGYWRHGATRVLVAREWLNGVKAGKSTVDMNALTQAVRDAIAAGGSGGDGTLTGVGVLASTGVAVIDSLGTVGGKPIFYIVDGGIGARQLAVGCLAPAKLDATGSNNGTSDWLYSKDQSGDGYWLQRSSLEGGGGGGGSGDITDVGALNGLIVVEDSMGVKPLVGLNVDPAEAAGADSYLVATGTPPRLHFRKGDGNTGGGGGVTNPLHLGSPSEMGQVQMHNGTLGGSDFVYTIRPSDTYYGDEGNWVFPIPANQAVAGRVLVADGYTSSRWRTYLSLEGSGSFAGGATLGDDQTDPVAVYGMVDLKGNSATATIANGADSVGVNLSWVTKTMRCYAWWTASRTASGATPAPPAQTVYAMTRTGRISIRASGTVTGDREVTYTVFTP